MILNALIDREIQISIVHKKNFLILYSKLESYALPPHLRHTSIETRGCSYHMTAH